MREDRAWVRLGSGRRLDLLNPDPTSWDDRDLAIGLSRTYRWGGHSCWDLPLSVAQHSLLVLVLRERMTNKPLSAREALRELLHDAHEGITCFDPITPLKPHLGTGFSRLGDRLTGAIATRYDLLPWSEADYLMHKRADHLAAASEALHVAGWPLGDIQNHLGINLSPLGRDPLPSMPGTKPWEPWAPKVAASIFLAKLRQLLDEDRCHDKPGSISEAVDRETTISALAQTFARLPDHLKRGCRERLMGSGLDDTYVVAEAHDGSESAAGVVVDADRDEKGRFDFDATFKMLSEDGEILTCKGFEGDVQVQ